MNPPTYTAPTHGWTCFHCGETFTSAGRARDHFGPTPDQKPLCSIVRTHTIFELARSIRRARMEVIEALVQVHTAEDKQAAAEGHLAELLRLLPGVRTANDVRNAIDVLEGRALIAENILGEIERQSPQLVDSARGVVCGTPS